MSHIGIVSTGDPEQDAKQLKQAQTYDERLKEGLCPNGCALLEWEAPYNAQCPKCRFMYSTNVPYGIQESEQIM